MFPLEPFFCPCCTPAILQTLAQSDLTRIPQQMLGLRRGALSAAITRHQKQPRELVDRIANPVANDALVAARKSKVSAVKD